MSEASLEKVKLMIKQLSPEDRKELFPYLAEFPDTGVKSCDLNEELGVIKKEWKLEESDYDPEKHLFDMVFVRNLVSVQILGVDVLRVAFLPDNFTENFIKAQSINSPPPSESVIEKIRSVLKQMGEERSTEEIEDAARKSSERVMQIVLEEKTNHIAAQISTYLPFMVGQMFGAAVKGHAISGFNALAEQAGVPDRMLSTEEIKKSLLKSYWLEIKPHIGVSHGGDRRTKPAWQGNEILTQYGQLVIDRRFLAESIKAMYEDCLGDDGWIQDLYQDANFQRLSQSVPDDTIAFAIKRVASEDIIPQREREPLSIACEMARQELELPEQEIETLRSYYKEGKKLIQQNRTMRSK